VKQLFVGAPFRGCGLGRQLATAIIDAGRAAGYATMKLDTMPSMRSAIELYESLGFRDILPYAENPIEGARFLELRLVGREPG
jgi:ribosomal protein S18 acetylase RimI-like enzyme